MTGDKPLFANHTRKVVEGKQERKIALLAVPYILIWKARSNTTTLQLFLGTGLGACTDNEELDRGLRAGYSCVLWKKKDKLKT